jgi:hypothetical protein
MDGKAVAARFIMAKGARAKERPQPAPHSLFPLCAFLSHFKIIMTSMSDWGPASDRCTQMVDRAVQVRVQ